MLNSLAQLPSAESEEENLTTTAPLETLQVLVRNVGFDLVARIGYLASTC
jgi:hypothetical protein